MNNYTLTFVYNNTTLDLNFSEDEIKTFEIYIANKFNKDFDTGDFKNQDGTIHYKTITHLSVPAGNEQMNKFVNFFTQLDEQFESITEILIKKNDYLYYDIKNIYEVNIQTSLVDKDELLLTIREGV